MSQLTYVFRTTPHSTASGREGIDALLAASAYCDDINVVFLGDGVYQLLKDQQTDSILSKDYAPMLKLFDLYDIESVYVCEQSMLERSVSSSDFVINVETTSSLKIKSILNRSKSVITF